MLHDTNLAGVASFISNFVDSWSLVLPHVRPKNDLLNAKTCKAAELKTADTSGTLLFSRSRFNSKKGVKKKGTKRLHFWSKIHSGIAYSI